MVILRNICSLEKFGNLEKFLTVSVSHFPVPLMKSKAFIPLQIIKNASLSNINYLLKNSNFISETTNFWDSSNFLYTSFALKNYPHDHIEYSSLTKSQDGGNFSERHVKHEYESLCTDLEEQNCNDLLICLEVLFCSS